MMDDNSFFFGGCLEALGSGLDLDLVRELSLDLAGEGRTSESAGVWITFGNPECGPRKLRMDEKCSQS